MVLKERDGQRGQRMESGIKSHWGFKPFQRIVERIEARLLWEAFSGHYRLLRFIPHKRVRDEAIFRALERYLDGKEGIERLERALSLGSDGSTVYVWRNGYRMSLSYYLLERAWDVERERWRKAFRLLGERAVFRYEGDMARMALPPWVKAEILRFFQYMPGGLKPPLKERMKERDSHGV